MASITFDAIFMLVGSRWVLAWKVSSTFTGVLLGSVGHQVNLWESVGRDPHCVLVPMQVHDHRPNCSESHMECNICHVYLTDTQEDCMQDLDTS